MKRLSKEYWLQTDNTLKCRKCGQNKPSTDFSPLREAIYRGGRHYKCKKCLALKTKEWKLSNPGKHNDIMRKFRAKVKQECFNHYGKECVWCGETNETLLTVDHVNNDGYLDRPYNRNLGRREPWASSWHMAAKQGFPNKFQILCIKCNFAKELNGGILPENLRREKILKYSLQEYIEKYGDKLCGSTMLRTELKTETKHQASL